MNKQLIILFLSVFLLVFTLPIINAQTQQYCCYVTGPEITFDETCDDGSNPVNSEEECPYTGDNAITIDGELANGPNSQVQILFYNVQSSFLTTTSTNGLFEIKIEPNTQYNITAQSENATHECSYQELQTFTGSQSITLGLTCQPKSVTTDPEVECSYDSDCESGSCSEEGICSSPSDENMCAPLCTEQTTNSCQGNNFVTTKTPSNCVAGDCVQQTTITTSVYCEFGCTPNGCEPEPEPSFDCTSDSQCPPGFNCEEGICVDPNLEEYNCPTTPGPGQCNINANPVFGDVSCQALGYQGGELNCYNECSFANNCFNCPSSPAQCESNMCDVCGICANSPVCGGGQCSQGDLTISVEPLTGQSGFQVTWDLPQECSDRGFDLRSDSGLHQSFGASQRSYNDVLSESLASRPQICYTVSTMVGDQMLTATQCAGTTHPSCLNKDQGESFCSGGNSVTCVDGQPQETECEGGCAGPFLDGSTMCLSAEESCDNCGGVFGLFTWVAYTATECSRLMADNICYREDQSVALSSVGEPKECSDVGSCSDYLTRLTCDENPCDLAFAQNCEWNDLGSNTGVGVCGSSNPEFVDCNSCEDSPLGCTEDVCNAYSDTCKFNGGSNTHPANQGYLSDQTSCLNQDQIICEVIRTEQECTGGTNFKVNVQYDSLGNRIGGTHQVIDISTNDLNGKCVWLETNIEEFNGVCVRDADSMHTASHIYDLGNIVPEVIADCYNNKDDLRCLTDFENPTTTLSINSQGYLYSMEVGPINSGSQYSLEQLKTITVQVQDNMYAPSEIDTYFSASFSGMPGYPTLSEEEFKDFLVTNFQPGTVNIAYYSADPSNNLEQIKTATLNLIPELEISYDVYQNHVFIEDDDGFLTDLTLSLWNPYATGRPQHTGNLTGGGSSINE